MLNVKQENYEYQPFKSFGLIRRGNRTQVLSIKKEAEALLTRPYAVQNGDDDSTEDEQNIV